MKKYTRVDNMLVSVIIPVYNVEPYLVEALDSVLNQTYRHLEILIINDGSTDGSTKICDDYAKKDSRVIVVNQENKGLSAARNTGLDLMNGEVVAFLDSDDAYQRDFIETMVSTMIAKRADIVLCKFTVQKTLKGMTQNETEGILPIIEPGTYERIDALRYLVDGKINNAVWNKIYKRELWKDIRFQEGRVYEDIDIMYRIIDGCKRITVFDKALYMYRRRPGSISNVVSMKNISDLITALMQVDSYIAENIPAIFSKECLLQRQQYRLNQMIRFYICYYSMLRSDKTWRQRIIKTSKENGINKVNFRTRMAYIIIESCPFILRFIYPIYYYTRLVRRRWTQILRAVFNSYK